MPFGGPLVVLEDPCSPLMKAILSLLLLTALIAACSSTGLSAERQACLEKATSEAERIECNKQSAIDADKKAEASK